MFVDPRWQRRGIGPALLDEVIDAARRDGRRLVTATANPGAVRFYRAAGFLHVGEVETGAGPAHRLALQLG